MTFSGVIWRCATEINSIRLHYSFVIKESKSVYIYILHLQGTVETLLLCVRKYDIGGAWVGSPPSLETPAPSSQLLFYQWRSKGPAGPLDRGGPPG